MQQPKGGFGLASQSEDQDENQLGIAGSMIWGLKKSVFNSEDFATYVISTYAAAP